MKIQGRPARIDPRTMTAAFQHPSESGITLRLDDSANPEAWLEITLSMAELQEAIARVCDAKMASAMSNEVAIVREVEGIPTEEEI